MPFLRQQLRVDPVGHEDAVPSAPGGSLRSARAAECGRGAAALETLFRADWERAAPRSRGHLAFTAESYLRARIVVEHVLAPELAAPLTLLAARYA